MGRMISAFWFIIGVVFGTLFIIAVACYCEAKEEDKENRKK